MESYLPHPRRPIWTHSNVLWINKLTSHVPNDNEHHILQRSGTGMGISIHEWHSNPHKKKIGWNQRITHGKILDIHIPYPGQTQRKQSVSKARKIRIQKGRNWVLRSNHWKKQTVNGPKETKRCSRLAKTQKPNRYSKISQIHWLLLLLYTKLLKDRTTTTWPYWQTCTMELDPSTTTSLQRTKNLNVLQPSANTTRLWEMILPLNRCIGIWHGHYTLTGERKPIPLTSKTNKTHKLPSGLLLSNLHPDWTELWHL
jgi:hypothetical protein